MRLERLFSLLTAIVGGSALACPSGQSAQCCPFLIPISIDGNVIDIGLGCINYKLLDMVIYFSVALCELSS